MRNLNGWVKSHRKFLKWEWYGDLPCRVLFSHLLLIVNPEDEVWRGITIKRGQTFTSIRKLAEESCLTVKQVRNALRKLGAHELAVEGHTKGQTQGTLISICNFEQYQQRKGTLEGSQRAHKGATNKEEKKLRSNTYSPFFQLWNTDPAIVSHKKYTDKMQKLEEKILKELDPDELNHAIVTYKKVQPSPDHYFSHKWTYAEFLQRENGARVFAYKQPDDYLEEKTKNKPKERKFKTFTKEDLPLTPEEYAAKNDWRSRTLSSRTSSDLHG